MSNTLTDPSIFLYKPCVYLKKDATGFYELYLTVWVDGDEVVTTSDTRDGDVLENVSCAVLASGGSAPSIPYAYQTVIPYNIAPGIDPNSTHFVVEVEEPSGTNKKSKVIIHHADADQPADGETAS